ncbi:DNA-directed RNA polymerase, mitochondrial [Sarcoramphus papa]
MSVLRLRAVLLGPARLRGAGIPWSVLRNYSSASAKEKARRNAICERTELLEVLKARVKQLQASNVPEVTVNKAELAPLSNDKYQDPLRKVVAPNPAEEQPAPRGRGESPARPSSWVEKLKKEMYIRQLKVERKLSIAASQLALGGQVKVKAKAKPKGKAKAKAKAKKSLKSPKAKVAAAWSQSHAGSRSIYAHSKPRVAAVKEGAKAQRPRRVLEDKDSSQYKILQQTIQSNLECFLFLQQPEEAERFLLLYHSSPVKRRLLNVNAYNIVMRSWARKGCLQRINRLFSMLESVGLQPSLDSYAAALECMGRNQSSTKAIWR